MNLLQFYESLLMTAGFTVSKDGAVSLQLLGRKEPFTIKGKRVVIPTREQLTSEDWNKRVVFHPMHENILKGETEVFSRFRKAMNLRLNMTVFGLLSELLTIAASPAMHKQLSPRQAEYLVALKDVDEKTLKNFEKIAEAIEADDIQSSAISIFLKRNGTLNEHRYTRVAVVSFPLYEELVKTTDNTVQGVKLRVKDVAALKALFEYILPGIDDADQYYSAGSDSKVAPYTQSLMLAVNNIVVALNEVVNLYLDNDEEKRDLWLTRTDWLDLIDDPEPIMNQLRLIPNQDSHNEGKETTKETLNAKPQSFEMPNQPVNQVQSVINQIAPQPTQQVQAAATKPKINSVDALLSATYGPQAVQPPALAAQPMYGQPAVPVNMYGQPVYQQPMPQMYNAGGWPVAQPQMQPNYGYAQPYLVGEYGYPVKP